MAAFAGVPGLAGAHEAAVGVVADAVAAHAAVLLALVDVRLAARARVACRVCAAVAISEWPSLLVHVHYNCTNIFTGAGAVAGEVVDAIDAAAAVETCPDCACALVHVCLADATRVPYKRADDES